MSTSRSPAVRLRPGPPRGAANGRALALALAAGAAALLVASGARAQTAKPATSTAAPVVQIGDHEQAVARRVEMTIGRSIIVDLPRDAKEVFVANPKVANAVVRSTRKLFLIGLENGATSIFVMDADGRQIAALEVSVGRDLNVLVQTLRSTFPHGRMDIKPAGDSIILLGTLSSSSEAQQAIDIANAFVGVSGGLFGGSKGAVINSITIRGKDQVMVRVTVAEIARTVLKQFGINTSASWKPLGSGFDNANGGLFGLPDPSGGANLARNFSSVNPFPVAPSGTPDTFLSGTAEYGGLKINATMRAFERAGVSRVLAEPTLTAISGESAKFTAGGEVPIPRSQDCAVANGIRTCTTGIEYKPYGVSLNFTPVVMSEGRISLRVGTEVTELDPEQRVTVGGINVLGTRVRRQETTVELPSGGTIMTAGLLQQQMATAINGTPGLMNLPILGALFRSRDYLRRETELVILVTPYIAKAVEPGQLERPDDGFAESHDGQALLLGRLNRLYGVVGGGAPGAAPKLKGRFGFITD